MGRTSFRQVSASFIDRPRDFWLDHQQGYIRTLEYLPMRPPFGRGPSGGKDNGLRTSTPRSEGHFVEDSIRQLLPRRIFAGFI